MSAEKRPPVDWESVEIHYRAGIRSLKDIGAEFGVSDAGIIKKAKQKEWKRDLSAKIRAKADAKVSASVVSAEVSAKRAANEAIVIEANAELQYRIRMGHRSGLARLRDVKDQLLEHVESVARNLPEIDQVVQMLRKEGENGLDKANDAMRRAMERSTVIDDLKKLAEIDERVRKGECLAFNIPMDGTDPDGTPATSKKRVLVEFVDAVIK
jgi:hypothetical protein